MFFFLAMLAGTPNYSSETPPTINFDCHFNNFQHTNELLVSFKNSVFAILLATNFDCLINKSKFTNKLIAFENYFFSLFSSRALLWFEA